MRSLIVVESEKTRTNETRWSGQLDGATLSTILLECLRDCLPTPHHGVTLEIRRVHLTDDPTELPAIDWEVVADHDWALRPLPGDDEPV